MALTLSSLALFSLTLTYCLALQEQVLSAFIFTQHGDRTPLYSEDLSILTPYGAQQMYTAGSRFRNRYLTTTFNEADDSTAIQDISHYQLNADEVSILSNDNQFVVASAQAFMQGLYPPLADASNLNYTQMAGISDLANGSNILAPLNGYQYAPIRTASNYDLNSIWVNGAADCPAWTERLVEYYNTSDFDFLYTSTMAFYQGLEAEFLSNNFSPNNLGYFDSYYIWDYLQYEYLHNATLRSTISADNMTRAQILAADWVYALFANSTDTVKSIAGRSLATQLLSTFATAIEMDGQTNKLNLWFGDFAPMVSFAALAGITNNQNAVFYNIPPIGSSFVFELFSLMPDGTSTTSFPSTSDMFVRFFFQNGTDQYSSLVNYPLFNRSPSAEYVSWAEFVNGLSQFSLSGVKEWCEVCGSYSIFCPAYTGANNAPSTPIPSKKGGLSPAVAGVIGALVALAVAAILFGLLMALAGFRVHRKEGKKRSSLAGFKGSQKLASDQDLTIPKGTAGPTVAVAETDASKGHERVGSWELKDQAKQEEAGQMGALTMPPARRPSFEDEEVHIDPYAPAVKPHDHV